MGLVITCLDSRLRGNDKKAKKTGIRLMQPDARLKETVILKESCFSGRLEPKAHEPLAQKNLTSGRFFVPTQIVGTQNDIARHFSSTPASKERGYSSFVMAI
jgi:hypothetical protein